MSGIPAGAGSLLGKRLGKYEILALLALGGTAEIYLARIGGAAGFEKYVVIKCLHDHLADDPVFVKMFLDEARLAACLDHSNIVQTMELGEYENRYFMVMEFLAGLSLAMVVRRCGERLQGGRIPLPLVLNLMAQSCAGLHYAHEKTANGKPLNVVHRDISPQNLVVSFEGVVKVVDFGIAKADVRETRTQSGTIKGKFAYMSPEQCVANNVDRRTDVFALGVIAHELLTGQRLFKKPSPYETYQSVIECAVAPPSTINIEIDPALDPIIMRALAKDKDGRYPSAEAFGDALLGYLHHRGKGSGPGDVARFFDASFAQEIEEHGARMRELISGQEFAVDTGGAWGTEDEKGGYETLDISTGSKDEKSMMLDTGDLVEVDRPSAGSLSDVIGDLDMPPGDEDDMPAERTRIEANPLERISELDKVPIAPRSGKTPPPQLANADGSSRPQANRMPPSGPLPLPSPPTGPVAAAADRKTPPPGRFPALANLPTMVAEPDPSDAAAKPPAPELAKTALGGQIVDPNARTNLQMQAPNVNGQPQRSTGSMPPQPRPSAPSAPMGYPVMNAQMQSEMEAGASVFPSARPGQGGGQPSGPTRLPEHGPQPRATDSGPQPRVPSSGPYDSQRAVDIASPVGSQYPQVDWAAAAAAPAKPIPPWLLGLLFVGAIGVALLVTILIAKLIR